MSDLFDMTIKPAFFSKLKPETQATYSMVINAAIVRKKEKLNTQLT